MNLICSIMLLSFFTLGCAENQSTKHIHVPNGAEVNISMNAGPVVETVFVQIILKNVSGFKTGALVIVHFPENEVKTFLKDNYNIKEIKVGSKENLVLDAPKTFILNIRQAQRNEQAYILGQDASLRIDIPYIVFQQIQLILQIDQEKINLPALLDERSSVQLDFNDIDRIIKISNQMSSAKGSN